MLGVPNARDDVFAKCARVEFVKERLIVDDEARDGTVWWKQRRGPAHLDRYRFGWHKGWGTCEAVIAN